MKLFRLILNILVIVVLISCSSPSDSGVVAQLENWESREVRKGVVWRSQYFPDFLGSPQQINVLDIDLTIDGIQPVFVYHNRALLPTHRMAAQVDGIAAINGNFFHTSEGGSVCYVKVNNKVVSKSRHDLGDSLFLDQLDDGGILLDAAGKIRIEGCPKEGWESLTNIPTIISAGPLLLLEGEAIQPISTLFNDQRFSRTAAGITKQNHLLLVTIDGNSSASAGMTIPELIQLMKGFGCMNAVNLDGGGSTTMWIKGESANGIVNYPTDNKNFDHYGERNVANCLVITTEK